MIHTNSGPVERIHTFQRFREIYGDPKKVTKTTSEDQKKNTCPKCGCVGLRFAGFARLMFCLLCRNRYEERE